MIKKMIPEIEFRYSWFYDNLFRNSKDIKELLKKKNLNRKAKKKYPTMKKVIKYRNEVWLIWKKHEKEILKAIQKVSSLKWKEKKIKVYFVGFHRPFSDPLTMPIYANKNYFIDILTHELIHKIQNQNIHLWKKWKKEVNKKYSKESDTTKNHIFLHAVHWKILLDLFGEKRLKYIFRRSEKFPDYKRSWEIVEKEGYENIIKKFKESQK